VLELGMGTGRLAIPLAARGLEVVGVDASPAMLARLGDRPRGDEVAVVLADMAALPLRSGSFGMVLCAFNTLFNLTNGVDQDACLAGCRRVLAPDGRLVIEAFVPPTAMPSGGLDVREITLDSVVLTATRHDETAQTIRGQHVEISSTGVRLRPWMLHYRTPTQLDVAARRVGLELEWRHRDWAGTPFGPGADVHVSSYRPS
ncbi:MAG: class I SAM-dependent methyltransferase, partial [Acidimicrobiales bacterium]